MARQQLAGMPGPTRPGRWWAGFASGMAIGTALGLRAGRWASALPAAPLGAAAAHGGWRGLASRTWTEFNEDRIPAVAAGVTFYSLLAIFPALSAAVALYGMIGEVARARAAIERLGGLLPSGALTVIGDQMVRTAQIHPAQTSAAFFLSLAVSLWSANAGMKELFAGLNVAYEERERRGFIRLNLESLLFTLSAVVLIVAALGAVAAAPEVLARFGRVAPPGTAVLRWPLLLIVSTVCLSLLYRFGPNRPHARWRWVTLGGGAAALAWFAVSLAFSWYVAHFGQFDRTYGSLGAMVGFMVWIWISLIVVLLGAEVNAEIEDIHPRET